MDKMMIVCIVVVYSLDSFAQKVLLKFHGNPKRLVTDVVTLTEENFISRDGGFSYDSLRLVTFRDNIFYKSYLNGLKIKKVGVALDAAIDTLSYGLISEEMFDEYYSGDQRNSLYLELGGTVGIIGVNYDRRIHLQGSWEAVLRVGLAPYGVVTALEFMVGKNKHYFDFGFGHCFFFTNMADDDPDDPYDDTTWKGVPTARMGYRYQAPSGFLIRLSPVLWFTDQIGEGNGCVLAGGLSLGYSF